MEIIENNEQNFGLKAFKQKQRNQFNTTYPSRGLSQNDIGDSLHLPLTRDDEGVGERVCAVQETE